MSVKIRAVVGICVILYLALSRSVISATGSGLQAVPNALSNLGAEGNVVLITGLAGAPKIHVRDPSIVDVTAPEVSGTAAAFQVTRVAAGATRIQVSDSSGSSLEISVADVPNCLPPPGHFRLLGREAGRTSMPHEPSHPTKLYFTTDDRSPDADEGRNSFAVSFAVRMIASDGSVQKGSRLERIDDSAVPVDLMQHHSGLPVYISYVEAQATNVKYHTWLIRSVCEPPYDLGTVVV